MKQQGPFYLARGGKAAGPFTTAEIERLRASGSLSDFRWIWDESQARWDALDPMPSGPPQKIAPKNGPAFKASRALVLFGAMGQAGLREGMLLSEGTLGCEIAFETGREPLPRGAGQIRVQLVDAGGAYRTEAARIAQVRGNTIVMEWAKEPLSSLKSV